MPKQRRNSPSRRPHLHAGALAPMVEQFTNDLVVLRYPRLTVSAFSDSSRHFADWICRSGIAPCDVAIGTIKQFAQHRCLCPGGRTIKLRGHVRAPDKLLAMLSQAAQPKIMRSDLGQDRGEISYLADDSA